MTNYDDIHAAQEQFEIQKSSANLDAKTLMAEGRAANGVHLTFIVSYRLVKQAANEWQVSLDSARVNGPARDDEEAKIDIGLSSDLPPVIRTRLNEYIDSHHDELVLSLT